MTETRDYEALEDRELDVLVAVRVMGWPKIVVDGFALGPMHYSTDPVAALLVLEEMRAKGHTYEVVGQSDGYRSVEVYPDGPVGATLEAFTGSAAGVTEFPRAVCLAALRALDAAPGA